MGNHGHGAREKMLIKIGGDGINLHVLFGHGKIRDGNADLTMAIAFVGEKFSNRVVTTRVGGDAVAGFGRKNHQFSAPKR